MKKELELERCSENIKNKTDTRDSETLETNWMLTDYNGQELGKSLVSSKTQVWKTEKMGKEKKDNEKKETIWVSGRAGERWAGEDQRLLLKKHLAVSHAESKVPNIFGGK